MRAAFPRRYCSTDGYPPPPLQYGAPPSQPWWVMLGLLGLPNRAAAMAMVWVCVGLTAMCLAVAHPRWLWGAGIILAAGWYWAAICWMDKHRAWRP